MRRITLTLLTLLLAVPTLAVAQYDQKKIEEAMSSAPPSVSANATVMDWDNTVLREGSNDWVCFPDMPQSPGHDPMCLDEPWLNWAHAWMNKTQPSYTRMGFGYMLAGGSPESLVRLTIFVTDRSEYEGSLEAVGQAYRRLMGRHYPAMALLEVKALLEPGAKVELEATAAIA